MEQELRAMFKRRETDVQAGPLPGTAVVRKGRLRLAYILGGALLVIGVLIAGMVTLGELDPSATRPAGSPKSTAEETSTSFLEAYGALDADEAIAHLAPDADILGLIGSVGAQDVRGTLDEFRLLISLLEAQGYEQNIHFCVEEAPPTTTGTTLRCSFDFHSLRSGEIGEGPFVGSYFLLTVNDGQIVRVSKHLETAGFSPLIWEPFADWVSEKYPEDAAVMYTDGTFGGARLTEESIRLWMQRTREYVAETDESRRLSREVEGIRFSFRLPKIPPTTNASSWEQHPVIRLPGGGFRNSHLAVTRSTVGPQGAEAIVFWTSFPAGNSAQPCGNLTSTAVGPSATDLAAAVAAAPGTELVSGPSDVRVGGLPAKYVVLTVREDAGCDPGFFYTWQADMGGAMWLETNVGDTIQVWIVDVDGRRLFIQAETTDQASGFLEHEIQQIIGSMRFDR